MKKKKSNDVGDAIAELLGVKDMHILYNNRDKFFIHILLKFSEFVKIFRNKNNWIVTCLLWNNGLKFYSNQLFSVHFLKKFLSSFSDCDLKLEWIFPKIKSVLTCLILNNILKFHLNLRLTFEIIAQKPYFLKF